METGLQPKNPDAQTGREERGAEEWWPSERHGSSLPPGFLAVTPALLPLYLPLAAACSQHNQPEGPCATGLSCVLLLCFDSSRLTFNENRQPTKAPFTSVVQLTVGILFFVMSLYPPHFSELTSYYFPSCLFHSSYPGLLAIPETSGLLQPQGLCTCCFLCLTHPSGPHTVSKCPGGLPQP